MRRLLTCAGAILLMLPFLSSRPTAAEDATTKRKAPGAEEFDRLVKEFNSKRAQAAKAYAAATTEREKELAKAQEPKLDNYTRPLLALAEQHPHDKFAVDALIWVVQRAAPGPDAERALDALYRDHLDSQEMGRVATLLVYSGCERIEERLRSLLSKSPHHDVQGLACISLARCLKMKPESTSAPSQADTDKCNHEAEALLQRVADQYGDVDSRGTKLKDAVAGELHEIHELSIGKPVPEIAGEDVHGKPFKLTDYRGKVVMLDFWGHW
jgi:hypothetical protein